MKVPRSTKPDKQHRYIFSMFFTVVLTMVMVATGGFGAFPNNPLTEIFQDVISENLPPEFLNPFNAYMEILSAPQIPPAPDSGADRVPPPDPVGVILSFFANDSNNDSAATSELSIVEATIAAIAKTQTQVVAIQSRTATETQVPTQTVIPSLVFTASPVPTLSATPSLAPLVYYFPPTATEEPEPELEPVSTSVPPPTFTPTNTPTPIPNHLTLYLGNLSVGNIGPRSSADALCTANLPTGFSNYHAFIGYSASDSIANMPSNYGVPTNLPIQSITNIVIANDWADLMDGSIAVALDFAGVIPSNHWWSGVENADGTHVDGTTFDCNDWTSNSGFVGGNEGFRNTVDTTWMDGFVAACDQAIAVLCVAY